MQRIRPLVTVLILVACLIGAPMVFSQDEDTIYIRNIGNLTTFNPVLYNDGASLIAGNYLWPPLFETDSFTGEPIPGLTSWTISEDNLTYSFTILEDANWSDGTPITSADIKFVIEATGNTSIESPHRASAEEIESINIIDDKNFELVMKNPSCVVWSLFSDFRALPSHRFAADFSDFNDNSLNTEPDISGGPYILEERVAGEFERYRANPDFYGGAPAIPYLVNRVIEDPAVLAQAIIAGEVDYATMRGDEFEQLPSAENLNYFAFPQHNVSFLALNWADPANPQPAYDADGNPVEQTPHPIFSDVNVRRAIAMAWNKDDILETLGGDQGGTRVVGSVIPTLSWAFNSTLEPYPYDPVGAAALLDEAGWVMNESTGIREKDGVPLSFTISYSDLLAYFETIALVSQDYFAQLGIDAQVEKLEWGAYLNGVFLAQKYDIAVLSNTGSSPPDPDNLAFGLGYSTLDIPDSGNNTTSYVNPEYDRLLDEARVVPGCDAGARADLYYQVQQIQKDDVAYDFILSPNLIQMMNTRVSNFNPGPWWGLYGFTQHVHEFTLE